jgi:hypothetical protein
MNKKDKIYRYLYSNVAPPSDTDANAFFTASGITNPTQQSAITNLCISLKLNNLWTPIKGIYPFVGGSASTHKWNLKDPRDLDAAFRLVFTGTSHSANGVTFDGSTGFADTKLAAATVFGSNPMSIHNYVRNWTSGRVMGNDGPVMDNSLAGNYQLGGGSISSIHPSWLHGLLSVTRQAGTTFKVYNGVQNNVNTDAFSTYATGNIRIGAYSFGGFSDCNVALSIIADALTFAQCQTLNGIVEAYQFALSRNILTEHFFGDSYTEAVVNGLNGWPTQYVTNKKRIEKNYGVGGTEIGAMDVNLIPTYRAGYDNHLWISYGLNEAGHNASPASTFAAILSSRVDSCIAKGWPANRIVINCGYFANAATWTAYGTAADDTRYQTFITAYQAVATSKGTLFVNPFSATDGSMIAADHVHWTATGVTNGTAYIVSQIP